MDGFCPVTSLYIHVPFCFHKCHYCDFYSLVDTRDRQEAFVERLLRELAALAPLTGGRALETIFVGGGTPSLLRPELWRRVLREMASLFDLSWMGGGAGEFTVECNPETVTSELMAILREGGVNRVSMGAQSFEARHLKTLERWHDPANVARAMELARGGGIERRSIDLIFGIPGQTVDEWRGDLRTALALGTEHLSCYSLTYEPNTAMTARMKRGEFAPMDEDTEVEMHREALRMTRGAGMERYEVSNYAKPGAQARHNLVYWRQGQWLAAGPSASGHVGGHRWKNVARLDDYLSHDDGGLARAVDHERPDEARLVREKIMTGLRLREGVDAGIAEEAERVSRGAGERLRAIVDRQVRRGQMQAVGGRWALTDEGLLFADGVAGEMMRVVGSVR